MRLSLKSTMDIAKRLREIRGDLNRYEFMLLSLIPYQEWKQYEECEAELSIRRLMQVCIRTQTSPSWILWGRCKILWKRTARRGGITKSGAVIKIWDGKKARQRKIEGPFYM